MTALVIAAVVLGPSIVTALAARRWPSTGVVGRVASRSLLAASVGSLLLLVVAALDDESWSGVRFGGWLHLDVDRISALLVITFTALGAVVSAFSARAFDDEARGVEHQVSLCVLVGGSALVALPGGPMPLLVGWIVSAWAIERLVSGWVPSTSGLAAYRRLRRATATGNLALVVAVAVAVGAVGADVVAGSPEAIEELGTTSIAGIGADVVFALLVVAAGITRSAQLPFHRWLTSTLYAPTPVSALVHAGYVAGAGLLLIRFAPIVIGVDVAVVAAGAVAIATIVIGSSASLTRPDTKGALAWSTVAQMGFMVVQCAIGALAGAVVHIIGHGMYKAAQFLGAGDTVVAGLRKRRRPVVDVEIAQPLRVALILLVPTAAVLLGLAVGPTGLDRAERILLAGAAWLAIAAAVRGLLESRALEVGWAIVASTAAGIGASVAYFAALRLAKGFLEPSIPTVEVDGSISTALAVGTLAAVVILVAVVGMPATAAVRGRLRWWLGRLTEIRPSFELPDRDAVEVSQQSAGPDPTTIDERGRSRLRSQVGQAAEMVAPAWPLSSFVAVNPLGGLEHLGFDDAARRAGALGGRAFRTLDTYRDEHRRGVTAEDDLARAAFDVAFDVCTGPELRIGTRAVAAHEIVIADALHGPEAAPPAPPRTELERRIGVGAGERCGLDELVASWVLDHVARPTWALGAPGESLWSTARAEMLRHARRGLGPAAVQFVEQLSEDVVVALDQALTVCDIPPERRVAEIAGLLTSIRGCAGLARWRHEWAHGDEPLPQLRPVELAAVQAMVQAAAIIELGRLATHADDPTSTEALAPDGAPAVDARVDAVIESLGVPSDPSTRDAVAAVVALLPDPMRQSIWQRAQELRYDDRILTMLDRVDPGSRVDRPASQVVFCIDVRSEGLRRHLEAQGRDETIGFAGFFGIPIRVRELGWQHPEPRCPVLVAPHPVAEERAQDEHRTRIDRTLRDRRAKASMAFAHTATKHVAGGQFATAEATGWITGPHAAWKTLVPPRRPIGDASPLPTTVTLGEGSSSEQLVYWAEAVLRTMGLTERFARTVVLCGHTSETVNNPHATALDCGACAGASGASNARAVAALLNRSDVRTGLRERGIDVPEDTWFAGAVHETTSDEVIVLDAHLAPPSHHTELDELSDRLRLASERQAADRARHLPGRPERVRDRGRDWAQTRPEWGLAANATFVIAPRSATAGLDLAGRCFLHSYDARHDPGATVLETIMTAPLVVGHWISAQYYFSATDPETYGAGDKLLHNPVGTVGVLTGAGGDLRVGLPLQSTHVDGRAFHQPLRLLAVIQADLTTIESIIARNPVLERLVTGSWLRIAARSHHHEPWSTRSPHGTWERWPIRTDPLPNLEHR